MTTAFVLGGGASLGAIQVGMVHALAEHQVRPDLIVGTSVGAVNGAWLAGHPDAPTSELAEIWRGLRRSDVFPADPVHGLFGFLGRRRGLVPSRNLLHLIENNLTFDRLEQAPIPFHVVVTDVLSTLDVRLSTGPAALAVLASASIPGVIPPVEIDGRLFMDGGVVNNTPISHALALGADDIWVLPTGFSCGLGDAPRSALGMALHGLNALVHQRLAVDVDQHQSPHAQLHVVPPPCPITTSPADFSAAAALIQRGYESATLWLQEDPHGGCDLSRLVPHDHPSAMSGRNATGPA